MRSYADNAAVSNQYIKTWVYHTSSHWSVAPHYMSTEEARVEAICREGTSYATDGQVFRFQQQWFGQDPPKRFDQAIDKPIDRYNKDGDSDLLLVSSDSMFFEVHTVILSKAS